MVDCYERRFRVARKAHRCEFCNGEVQPGELHQVETGLYENEWFRRRLHLHCAAALDEMLTESGETEFTWCSLHDWLEDRVCARCPHQETCTATLPNCVPVVATFSETPSRPALRWIGP